MDNKITDIRPLGMEPWQMPDPGSKDGESIRPVPKGEQSSFQKLNRESVQQQDLTADVPAPEQTRELIKNVQNYLSDLDISLSFEIHEQTGELVTKVINRDTEEVIRQIPPEVWLNYAISWRNFAVCYSMARPNREGVFAVASK